LAELGIIASASKDGESALLRVAISGEEIPEVLKGAFAALAEGIRAFGLQIAALDRKIAEVAKSDETCVRLQTIPGIGPVTSSMILAFGGDLSRFTSARHFAAWLGLTPRQNASGATVRIGRISKAGDKTLRSLLVFGAFTAIKQARAHPERAMP
jgi:transposase